MGAFKDKSDETFSSGELLLSNAHYNSSVHCFYYSCFQLVKDLLKEEYKYSDSQMNSGTNNSSSHDKIINQLKICLLEESRIDYNIISLFSLIKKARKKADYEEQNIGKKEAEKTKDRATEIRKELNKIYRNGI